jgi:hypothetical protein
MIVEIHRRQFLRAVCIGIVTPAHYSGIQYVGRQHVRISQPIHLVLRRPGLLLVTIKAMYCDDTRAKGDN